MRLFGRHPAKPTRFETYRLRSGRFLLIDRQEVAEWVFETRTEAEKAARWMLVFGVDRYPWERVFPGYLRGFTRGRPRPVPGT